MKISDFFKLDASQYELDFVNIDPELDTPLFIDTVLLRNRKDAWSKKASASIKIFFDHFLELLMSGKKERARELFDYLHEPNETCLGLSAGKPRGSAIGDKDGAKLFDIIEQNFSTINSHIENVEDLFIFVDGIGQDKISDIATNVIKSHLLEYTINQCNLWGIPLQDNVSTGFFWDSKQKKWEQDSGKSLVIDGKLILLVPKHVVSFCKRYTPHVLHRRFVLEFLQRDNISRSSPLVKQRKNGNYYVTKKSLEENGYSFSKELINNFVNRHPDVFADFKDWADNISSPENRENLTREDEKEIGLIAKYLQEKLKAIPKGNENASSYHKTVVGILDLLLYPDIVSPRIESEIHQGRKRIDITFDNSANQGFFHRLSTIYRTPCQFIMVECKNYSKDVNNPELDQLAGRFSMNRGKFGMLLFRDIKNEDKLIERCRDTYKDDRGIIIPIVDKDLIDMLDNVIAISDSPYEDFFAKKYRLIALS